MCGESVKKDCLNLIRHFCILLFAYYMLNLQHVTQLFMGNMGSFHLAYVAKLALYVSWAE